jgi:hypothetical protein
MDDSRMHTEVIKRLNIIVSLLLNISGETKNITATAKVQRLIDNGLTPAEVANILGKPINYITAILTQKSKRKGGKNARETK